MTEAFASYVPALVLRRLQREPSRAPDEPWAERVCAAVLCADVSGSTALAERLAEHGAAGAEELGRILNAFFGELIEAVTTHGGDVVKFAGDGLFALWPSDPPAALNTAVWQAVQCAVAAQQSRRPPAAGATPSLSMRIGIGAGWARGLTLAWTRDHVEFLVVGAPVAEACHAQRDAQPGEVVVSAAAWALIGDQCTGTQLRGGAVRIAPHGEAVSVPPAAEPDPLVATDAVATQALRGFAPPTVAARLDAGHSGWIAELRRITALFIQLPDWNETTLATAQETIAVIYAVLQRYAGTVARLGMDASGPVVKAAFGLPPHAHEDDPVRAAQAALEMDAALRARRVPVAIGLATGRAFCAEVGNMRRREYTTVGAVVHLAARLMQAGETGVLCDAATRDAGARRLTFETLAPLTLKGWSEPVAVYRPYGQASGVRPPQRTVLGRAAERAQLHRCLDDLIAGRGRQVVVIEGEAGMGKSRLIDECRRQAEALPITCLVGSGDAIESSTAYHAWRPILSLLLRLDRVPADSVSRRAHVLSILEGQSGAEPLAAAPPASLAPLLNPVLALDFPESQASAQIGGEARADITHELLVRLLRTAAEEHPLLVIFEDAHWLDSASWAVAELMAARVQPLLVIAATRPLQEPLPPAYRRLLQSPDTRRLPLGLLGAADTSALVADRLGVRSVSEQVLSVIHARAGGHPFFTEELTFALRDSGLVRIGGDECRVAPQAGDLQRLALPETVEATLTGRIDLLDARQQLALKVASVFGRTFSGTALRQVHPIEADRSYLDADLAVLERLDLIERTAGDGGNACVFKHAITRDVAYDLMAFAQRRHLHRAVAEWYERNYAADLGPYYPLLAHHWSRATDANDPDTTVPCKAIDALERAGEQAMASYANGEAVQLFEEALRLHAQLGDRIGPMPRRRARWYRHLADATNRLGKIPEAIQNSLQALQCLDRAFPSNPNRQYAGIARQLGAQLLHRLAPFTRGRASGSARDEALEAAHLYELLGLMWYVTSDGVPSLLANLCALNLAERAGPSPELATSSAMIGLSAGVLLGPAFSEHYFRQGQDAARHVGDRYGYGRVCYNRGLLYTGEARWAEANSAYLEALTTFKDMGEARWRDIATSMLASTCFLRRRYADARRGYEASAASPRERGDVQGQAWASIGVGTCLVVHGESAEALAAFDRLTVWLANNFTHLGDRGAELIVHAMRGMAHFRLGQFAEARCDIEANLRIVRSAPALLSYVLPGYTLPPEICLRIWEGGHCASADIVPMATEAVRNLRGLARLYRLARPSAKLWSGLLWWLQKRPRRARAAWEATIALARAQDMPHEEGLAHFEIGRHLPPADPERRRHLERACDIFSAFELPYELAEAQRALSEGGQRAAVMVGGQTSAAQCDQLLSRDAPRQ